jgi:putative hydrolase of the HAD superfamily
MASKKMTTARRLAALYEGSYRARTNLESEAIMIAGDRWDGVRAVAFDAVGTLITPMPPAAEVYAAVGRRFGSRLDVAAIAECFHRAFRDEENRDRLSGWRTDAAREVERWRSIVANVLPDVVEPEKCFRSLWDHFARPESWQLVAGAPDVFAKLRRMGLRLGIATNFDSRLHSVLLGFPAFSREANIIISAEIGWRKPAAEFFAAVVERLGVSPGEALMVGDEFENDIEAARAAGLRAVLLDPGRRAENSIGELRELVSR